MDFSKIEVGGRYKDIIDVEYAYKVFCERMSKSRNYKKTYEENPLYNPEKEVKGVPGYDGSEFQWITIHRPHTETELNEIFTGMMKAGYWNYGDNPGYSFEETGLIKCRGGNALGGCACDICNAEDALDAECDAWKDGFKEACKRACDAGIF